MKFIKILPIVFFTLSSIYSYSQNVDSVFNKVEDIRTEFGQYDDRYLTALSDAIRYAVINKEDKRAFDNRLIHVSIIKEKYGEMSVEYADDIVRLGTAAYGYSGIEDALKYWIQGTRIFEQLNVVTDTYQFALGRIMRSYQDNKEYDSFISTKRKLIKTYDSKSDQFYLDCADGIEYSYSSHHYNDVIEFGAVFTDNSKIKIENPDVRLLHEYVFQLLSLTHTNLHDNKSALEIADTIVSFAKVNYGENTSQYASSLYLYGLLCKNIGQYDLSLTYFKKCVDLYESLPSSNSIELNSNEEYFSALKFITLIYGSTNNLIPALQYNLKLKKIYISKNKTDDPDYLSLIEDLILTYHGLKEYKIAIEEYDTYQRLAIKLGKDKSEEYINMMVLKLEMQNLSFDTDYKKTSQYLDSLIAANYGTISRENLILKMTQVIQHVNDADKTEAINLIDESYSILKDSQTKLFLNESDSLVLMSAFHNNEGMVFINIDNDRAEKVLLQSIEEAQKCNTEGYDAKINLALLYSSVRGDYEKADSIYSNIRESYERNEKTYPKNSMQYLQILNNSALAKHHLGRMSEAIAILEEGIKTIDHYWGKNNLIKIHFLMNKALFLGSVNNPKDAIIQYEKCIEIFKINNALSNEQYPIILQNMGLCYMNSGNLSKAEYYLNEALNISKKNSYPDTAILMIYSNLITLYSALDDVDKLLFYANDGVNILSKGKINNPNIAASFLGSLGWVFFTRNNPKSQELLYNALEIVRETSGITDYRYLSGLVAYGLSCFIDSIPEENIIEDLFEVYKAQYFANYIYYNNTERESLLSNILYLNIKNLIFSSRTSEQFDTILYDYLLFSKGLLVNSSLNFSTTIRETKNQNLIDKYDRLIQLQRYLRGEMVSIPVNGSYDEIKYQASLLEREISTVLKSSKKYRETADVSYTDVQNSLGKADAAIEFINFYNFNSQEQEYAAILLKKTASPEFIPLGKSKDFETLLSKSPADLYSESELSVQAYNKIWKPIMPYLKNTRNIYFSPDGFLHRIAIEYLWNGDRRMNSIYNLRRVSSTKKLDEQQTHFRPSTARIYGGLDFDVQNSTMLDASRKYRTNQPVDEIIRGSEDSLSRSSWNYLPGTLTEVKSISDIFSNAKIEHQIFTHWNGNEESFKALSGQDISLIHLATHGFYFSKSNSEKEKYLKQNLFINNISTNEEKMMRAGLLMAGANKAWSGKELPIGVEDGILSASEISSLDLSNCQLVVLSACDTALGDISEEGVWGLQRAFKSAGVKSIIMTLWNVNDIVTSTMMDIFYDKLIKTGNKYKAFNFARNQIAKDYPDPRYWASFIMLD